MLKHLLEESQKLDLLKNLFQESKTHIEHFFQQVDTAQAEPILQLCAQCKGLVIFSGVGKSGFIAEKIAATWSSTGTKSLYISPTNFLHGDIGILSQEDVVIFLSKSGETEELLQIFPFIQKRGTKIITWTSNAESRLARISDLSMLLPMPKELCQFNLVPTTSTEVQLIFGNILSIALMKLKGFNLEDYVLNHPSGAIGKKMTLTVKDLMLSGNDLPLCQPEQKLGDLLVELTQKRCGVLLIVDHNSHLKGIFTDGDLRRSLHSYGTEVLHHTMKNLMTISAIAVHPDTLAWDAMKEMQKDPTKWVMTALVLQNNQLVGLLRMHDVIHAGLS